MTGMKSSRISHPDSAVFIHSENARQTPSIDITTPSTAQGPTRTVFTDDVAINVDNQQPSPSSDYHSINESRPVPPSVSEDQPATSTSACSLRELVRQVTFVQIDLSPTNLPESALQGDDSGTNEITTSAAQRPSTTCCRSLWSSMDSVLVCYIVLGFVLIAFGAFILFLVAFSPVHDGTTDQGRWELWIVGPVFICSGVLLVSIKTLTHICIRLHSDRFTISSDLRRSFMTSDSRSSLFTQRSLPPNYSAALRAPIPSGVLEEDDKLPYPLSEIDAASLARVTINIDPPPPTYEEALEILRRDSQLITPPSANVSSAA